MISIIITTYGDRVWEDLAWSRAYPSTIGQGAHEVIVNHIPDSTIGSARNITAKLAKGKWLIFLDADDELAPGYVEAMERSQEGRDADAVVEPRVSFVLPRGSRTKPEFHQRRGTLEHTNYIVVGAMVGRELFERVGGFGDYPHGFEDWALWAKCWKAGAAFRQAPEAVYIVHINRQSKRRQLWRNRREQQAEHNRIQAELFPHV